MNQYVVEVMSEELPTGMQMPKLVYSATKGSPPQSLLVYLYVVQ
jgi:hypothetical protein